MLDIVEVGWCSSLNGEETPAVAEGCHAGRQERKRGEDLLDRREGQVLYLRSCQAGFQPLLVFLK